jgi:cytochrome c
MKSQMIFVMTALAGLGLASASLAQDYQRPSVSGLGAVASDAQIAAWDIDVRPDGLGLPVGKGTAEEGEAIFGDRCAQCHGDFGEGVDRWPVLTGGQDTLAEARPEKTIGSYWPYSSTLFDYIYRAMPYGEAKSLTPDEVYAISAYLLAENEIVERDEELNQDNFAQIKMPNQANFFADDRAVSEVYTDRCMSGCKAEAVSIVSAAPELDVTPEENLD